MTPRSARPLLLVAGIGAAAMGLGMLAARGAGLTAHPVPAPAAPAASAPVLAAAPSPVSAPADAAKAVAPAVRFEPAALDLGTVAAGSTVRGEAWIVNAGSAPVVLDRVSGSCGCTRVEASSGTLAAGEKRHVAFSVTTPAAPDRNKNVTVTAALAGREPIKLPVTLRTAAP